jgi:hypothetical protein
MSGMGQIWKKRPSMYQKRPSLRQKRPTNTSIPVVCQVWVSIRWQKRPTMNQNRPAVYQKRPPNTSTAVVCRIWVSVSGDKNKVRANITANRLQQHYCFTALLLTFEKRDLTCIKRVCVSVSGDKNKPANITTNRLLYGTLTFRHYPSTLPYHYYEETTIWKESYL